MAAFIEDLVETSRHLAAASPGARLDPPLLMALDEIGNLSPLPSLPAVMAEGGGTGITTMPVLQSLSQGQRKGITVLGRFLPGAFHAWSCTWPQLVPGHHRRSAVRPRRALGSRLTELRCQRWPCRHYRRGHGLAVNLSTRIGVIVGED